MNKLKEQNPQFKEPNLDKWAKEIDLLVRRDKRTFEQLKTVINWAFSQQDHFWPTAILSPTTLRKLFDKAWMKLNHKSQQDRLVESQNKKQNLIEENRKWAMENMSKIYFTNRDDRYMKIQDNYIEIRIGNSSEPIGYALPAFKEIILNKIKSWGN